MTLALTTIRHVPESTLAWSPPAGIDARTAGAVVGAFLDTAMTSLGRATAYGTRGEQQAAELSIHDAMIHLDRALYATLLSLPGVADRARQVGVRKLLGTPIGDGDDGALERRLVASALATLPPQRALKAFESLRVDAPDLGLRRVNGARARKAILRWLLSSPRLELWTVKYRAKVCAALTHAWGQRLASIVRSILSRDEATWTVKERRIVRRALDVFAPAMPERARACVAFALRSDRAPELALHRAFEDAKRDLGAGAALPPEVLEGVRSTFHRGTPKEDVLRVTAGTLTSGQRLAVQRRAKDAGVDVAVDLGQQDAVRLYLYAFATGMTPEIARALEEQAVQAARRFPVRFRTLGVLVDASASMAGSHEQPLRPMAVALAVRDVLRHVGEAIVVTCGGDVGDDGIVRPTGHTALAEGLLDLLECRCPPGTGSLRSLERGPDAVFVVSDGYENRPAGRFAEVVSELRALGVATPIYQLAPVFAAEAAGVRKLAAEVPALPVQRPDAMSLSFVRAMLDVDPIGGVRALIGMAHSGGDDERGAKAMAN